MNAFIIGYCLGTAAETAVVLVVKQDHAAGVLAGIKVLKPRQDRSIKVGIQTDQSKTAVFQPGCSVREKPFVK